VLPRASLSEGLQELLFFTMSCLFDTVLVKDKLYDLKVYEL